MKIWNRIVYRSPGKYHNFLMHPFLLMTAAYGIALVFYTATTSVRESILYSLTISTIVPDVFVSVWGIAALVITVLTFVGIVVRNHVLGTAVSMSGFMLWFYAFWLYALNGFWLQVFFAAIPNLIFWGWFYFSIKDFHRKNLEKP